MKHGKYYHFLKHKFSRIHRARCDSKRHPLPQTDAASSKQTKNKGKKYRTNLCLGGPQFIQGQVAALGPNSYAPCGPAVADIVEPGERTGTVILQHELVEPCSLRFGVRMRSQKTQNKLSRWHVH